MSDDDKERLLQSVRKTVDVEENSTSEGFSYFIIGLFFAVFILIIVIFGMEKAKTNKSASLEEVYQSDVTAPLESLSKEQSESDTAVRQLEVLTTALGGRIKYSQLMNDLTASQFKKSLWKSFTLRENTISIQGISDNFDDAARSVAAFRSMKAVKDVSLKAVNVDENTQKVDFTIQITFDSSLYKYLPQTTPSATPEVKL